MRPFRVDCNSADPAPLTPIQGEYGALTKESRSAPIFPWKSLIFPMKHGDNSSKNAEGWQFLGQLTETVLAVVFQFVSIWHRIKISVDHCYLMELCIIYYYIVLYNIHITINYYYWHHMYWSVWHWRFRQGVLHHCFEPWLVLLSHRPQEFLDDGHGNVKGIKMVNVRWEKIDGQMRHLHRRNLTQREVGDTDLAVDLAVDS